MKLNTTPKTAPLDPVIQKEFRDHAVQVNLLSEGKIAARYSATTASPTTGTWARGDYVTNSEPSELGSGGSKYVIKGWICVVAGEPGTWVQDRCLTGN